MSKYFEGLDRKAAKMEARGEAAAGLQIGMKVRHPSTGDRVYTIGHIDEKWGNVRLDWDHGNEWGFQSVLANPEELEVIAENGAMTTTLTEHHPSVRAAVLALDRGGRPTGPSLEAAVKLGLAHIEHGEAMLTHEGCAKAQAWRKTDDHGGDAA